jgi:hypothetical protein
MTVEAWSGRTDPFDHEPDAAAGYLPWRSNKGGAVRDLIFHPAPGSGQPKRGESYLQVMSWELDEAETTLFILFHTSGQIVRIKGRGLGELIEQISAKRTASVHVWHPDGTEMPAQVITDLKFDRAIADLMPS